MLVWDSVCDVDSECWWRKVVDDVDGEIWKGNVIYDVKDECWCVKAL